MAEETGTEANARAKTNVQFREQAGEFMTIMDKHRNLQHDIELYDEQIAAYEESMTLLNESEDELRAKLQSFGRSLDEKKRRSQETQNKKSDELDTLRGFEKELSQLVQRRGQLIGEKKMHEEAVVRREETAKMLCVTYELKGYDYSPLEKVKINEILDKLKDVKKRQENANRQLRVSHHQLVNVPCGAPTSEPSFIGLTGRVQVGRGGASKQVDRAQRRQGDQTRRTKRTQETACQSRHKSASACLRY